MFGFNNSIIHRKINIRNVDDVYFSSPRHHIYFEATEKRVIPNTTRTDIKVSAQISDRDFVQIVKSKYTQTDRIIYSY